LGYRVPAVRVGQARSVGDMRASPIH
jgi:hypothetical protein